MKSLPLLSKKIFFSFIAFIILLFFAFHSQNFRLDASSDTLILQNDDNFKYFNYYNNVFPTKSFLVLAIKSEKIIDVDYINQIKIIINKLEKLEGIESIFSITDAPILLMNDLKLSDLKNKQIQTLDNSQIDINKALNELSKSPIFHNQIINTDKTVSSLIIYLKKDDEFFKIKKQIEHNATLNTQEDIANYNDLEKKYRELKIINNKNRNNLIREIRDALINENISYKYFLGGIDMIADDTLSFIKNDIIVFSISVLIFIFIVLFLIFRSIKWVLVPIISTTYSIICMTGLMGFLNWEVTAISSNFISLMFILSISMCIHIINNYRLHFDQKNFAKTLNVTLKRMFWPCFYTVLTTIVAFGSLIFSDIKPVIDFGKIMILGLVVILATSFTILPLLISIFPKIDVKKKFQFSILPLFFNISVNHNMKIYAVNLIIFAFSVLGISKLNVENSFINYFKQDTEIYKGMKLIDQELGGTTPLDVIIKFNDENNYLLVENISSNDEIELEIEEDLDLSSNLLIDNSSSLTWFTEDKILTIKSIHKYLDEQKEIGKVLSISSLIDLAEQINKKPLSLFELSVLYNEIPENYKNDLISPYLSIDDNMIKISARIKDSEDIKRGELINNIQNHLSKKYESIEEVHVNGLMVLYNDMLQSLFSSQIKSFGIVLIAIFAMFLILFRSVKLSIIGIIPNILASSFILGFIGLLGIPLDIMTITIAAITIGIAVDNTIHYLYKARDNIYNKNMRINDSLENSHRTVGQAVLTTSLTIAFGFSVLCLSNFVPTILFGLFTAIAMLIAMLGVLITLPAGLIKIKL